MAPIEVTAEQLQNGISLATDQLHTIVIDRKKIFVIEADDLNFNFGSSILLPTAHVRKNPDQDLIGELEVLTQALRFIADEGKPLLLAGHTDSVGSQDANIQLSQLRADNVLLFLQGDYDGWAAACEDHKVADYQCILKWLADFWSWDCNPGKVDNLDNYVTGFVRPVPSAAPASGYPEVSWSENSYEVFVNNLCDQTDLAATAQQTTRFHRRLLDALDIANDRPHGLIVLLAYVSAAPHANSAFAAQHAAGHACDLRPSSGTNAADWYNFYQAVNEAVSYINHRDGSGTLALSMLQDADPPAGRPQITATANATEWLNRLQKATAANDASLVAPDPRFPNLIAELAKMRVHLETG